MLSYCLKCRKNTESKDPKFLKINKGRIMLSSKFAIRYNKKNLKLSKKQEAEGLLSIIGKIPILGPLLI